MTAFPRLPVRLAIALILTLPGMASAQNAEAKAWAIQLPLLEFREATVEEGIRFLAAKSRDLDPTHQGVNIVCISPIPAEKRLTLRLANVPLREAVRYVARLSRMRLSADQHALILATGDPIAAPPIGRISPTALRASEIILPQVAFRDATVPEAIDFITAKSRALDPKKQGINVVLDVPPERREARITLNLRDVPLGEALRYAAQLAGLEIEDETYALVVMVPRPKPAKTP